MSIDRRTAIAVSALLAASLRFPVPARAAAAGQDARIAALIGRMTLAEKLGQMTQIPGGRQKALNSRLDAAMLDRVRRGEVGSFLHVAGAAALRDLQKVAVTESRLGIPLLFAMDVIHGYRTVVPVPLALAASFDPEVARAAARLAAEEAWAAGLHWTFAPMVDVARDPRWGRVVEGAGEDPYLGSRVAEAQVRGFQEPDLASGKRVMACAKHFAGYGAAAGGRDYDSADLSERTLNEVYLPPFHAAVAAGAGSFMTAFNDIAGVPMTANAELVRGHLRGEWGYRGLVVSDWNAVKELIAHGVAGTPAQAAALALRAGVDMDMASGTYAEHLAEAVQAEPDLLPLVDEAVGRILGAKAALGLFDDPYGFGDPAQADGPTPASRAVARDLARRSIVLLRNEGDVLPVAAGKKVALIGALADDAASMLGSWRGRGQVEDAVTLRRALEARGVAVEYRPGVLVVPTGEGTAAAIAAARRADVVVFAGGEDYDRTGEARSYTDIDFDADQAELLRRLVETGKPVVVVLMNGRPLALGRRLAGVPAVLEAWYLGVEAGPAIAEVLLGEYNPGGKLPIGFPNRPGAVPAPYAHVPTGRPADRSPDIDSARYRDDDIVPALPFGHGLSYTSFSYGRLTVHRVGVGPDEPIVARVQVTNTGKRAGDEVVQLYARDPVASVARPVKELRGFARVTLQPGETRRVTFTLVPAQFAIWKAGRWVIEPGRIDLMVGGSSESLHGPAGFTILGGGESKVPAAAIATRVEIA